VLGSVAIYDWAAMCQAATNTCFVTATGTGMCLLICQIYGRKVIRTDLPEMLLEIADFLYKKTANIDGIWIIRKRRSNKLPKQRIQNLTAHGAKAKENTSINDPYSSFSDTKRTNRPCSCSLNTVNKAFTIQILLNKTVSLVGQKDFTTR
jgi:predicted small secreted protein